MKKLLGNTVRVNVYGTIYDGIVVDVNDNIITLEEDCGSTKLVKMLFKNNIAAIETRMPK